MFRTKSLAELKASNRQKRINAICLKGAKARYKRATNEKDAMDAMIDIVKYDR